MLNDSGSKIVWEDLQERSTDQSDSVADSVQKLVACGQDLRFASPETLKCSFEAFFSLKFYSHCSLILN
jgi:hypothetical protein